MHYLSLIFVNMDYIDMGRGASHLYDPGGSAPIDR